MTEPSSRSAGLDTLRAAAIVLVFMYHYMCFVSGEATFGWASEIGWAGVDLFFVLSGYLIANQLFRGMALGQPVSAGRFYARRALRTLPVFWLILATYWLFPARMGGHAPPSLWRFLSFTQNLGLQPGTAFSHAWSLCVEEQFYLLLPLVLVIGHRFASPHARRLRLTRWHGWTLMAFLVVTGIATRAALWFSYGRKADGHVDGYMSHIYYATLCRFDEFVPGVAIAMLKNFHQPLWNRAMAHGNRLLATGAVAAAVMLTVAYRSNWIAGYGYGFFMTAFGYSLLALAFALLVAAALSPMAFLYRLRIPGVEQVALWSYSIYLSHRPLANLLLQVLLPMGVSAGAVLAIISGACLAMGALLYRTVELPLMAWRDRVVPSNFGASSAYRESGCARAIGGRVGVGHGGDAVGGRCADVICPGGGERAPGAASRLCSQRPGPGKRSGPLCLHAACTPAQRGDSLFGHSQGESQR